MILERLDALRGDFSECEFLAFADISSRTVLCVSTDEKIPQEILDGYCATATALLGGDVAAACLQALALPDENHLSLATILSPEQSVFFLRSAHELNEAILCRCTAGIDVESFIPALRAGLTDIAAP